MVRVFINFSEIYQGNMQLELTEQILNYIQDNESADTIDLAAHFNENHQKIIGKRENTFCVVFHHQIFAEQQILNNHY